MTMEYNYSGNICELCDSDMKEIHFQGKSQEVCPNCS